MNSLEDWTSPRSASTTPWIVAHRGASFRHRESSPEAFEAAIAEGASAVETDVRRTTDGVLVCHHDETLRRTANVDRAISSLTFEELRTVAPDYCVPLSDVLERTRGRINVLLDLKLERDDDIAALLSLLAEKATGKHVAIGARLLHSQAFIAARAPSVPLLGLLGSPDEVPAFVAAGGNWVRLWERDASAERIASVRALQVPVLIMVGGEGTGRTIGQIDSPRIAELLALGADGLMLDDPALVADSSRPA
ncbi:MAG TPA: glycerophosphodiester phosphodiesterase family protein [Devosia sp.]|nr:glycerophosphodiester phosphodiesterase family protein [Devosia sp.]